MALPLEDRCSLASSCSFGSFLSGAQNFASGDSSSSDDPDSKVDHSLAMAGLCGSVSQGDRCYAFPLAKYIERECEMEKDDYAWSADSMDNEGLILDEGNCLVGASSVLVCLFVSLGLLE